MDVTQMSREDLEAALIRQTGIAKSYKAQRDHYKIQCDTLHTQYLQLSQVTLTMRNMAQQIIMVGLDGQDCTSQAAALAGPSDS